jgi:hypothetical protein
VSPLCSRNARSQKALVGRAQWGTHPGLPRGNIHEQAWKDPILIARCGLAWDKARPWAKRLSWQTQGGRVK